MTISSAAPELGGVGSVLAIWSLLVVIIGATLFGYAIVVTLRGRNRRRRRRRASAGQQPRPMPPPPASRPLALPSGPTAGGVPVRRHLTTPRPRALPAGPSARPLALPAAGWAPGGYPSTAQPHYGVPGSMQPRSMPPGSMPPSLPAPTALPAGPTVGTGYGPAIVPAPDPAIYGPPPSSPVSALAAGAAATSEATTVTPSVTTPTHTAPAHTTPAAGSPTSGIPAGHAAASTAPAAWTQLVEELPAAGERTSRLFRRTRTDECATLRAECEQLREIAAAAAAEAEEGATQAEAAHAAYVAAQRTADEARRRYEQVAHESTEVSAQVANLERVHIHTQNNERLQAETSHAAFAAYRRGDISSEQLREVFRRAEGWTPEHDRLSRRSTELRAEEAEAMRTRDAAVQAEQAAAEHARITAVNARALDDRARTAAADARGRCAAADACEQRNHRR